MTVGKYCSVNVRCCLSPGRFVAGWWGGLKDWCWIGGDSGGNYFWNWRIQQDAGFRWSNRFRILMQRGTIGWMWWIIGDIRIRRSDIGRDGGLGSSGGWNKVGKRSWRWYVKGRSYDKMIWFKIPVRKATLVVLVFNFYFHRSGTRNVKGRDHNTMAFVLDGDVVEGSRFVEGV